MIQNMIHQEKDSWVQGIPWKGIPVGYEVAPAFLMVENVAPLLPNLVHASTMPKPHCKATSPAW